MTAAVKRPAARKTHGGVVVNRVQVGLSPDLLAVIDREVKRRYSSRADVVRSLIVEGLRRSALLPPPAD